ncbi:LCP family glycopolymer transferase [Brevibacillus reuszeri]|uniref:LCP family glycopolymer transferase n=1 Tax=Brevibacillus reuszeri TaxID=54915 RepID=UPI00289844BE|nr:LCP family protein [Brevibacillus reuszeri]
MKRYVYVLLIVVLIVCSAMTIFFFQLYANVKATASMIYEPLPPVEAQETTTLSPQAQEQDPPPALKPVPEAHSTIEKKPLTLLLFGVDKREGDVGRSDTLILLTINPEKKQTLMMSIPRDTRTQIVGRKQPDKINHAYHAGGIAASVRTVEQFLDIPIDYYVKVEMEGFSNIIDSLGGVTVDNTFAFDYEGYQFPKGSSHMDGEKALAYVRMRYDDPEGDFGRNKRQQQVIRDLMDKAKGISTVSKLDDLLAAVGSSFKTNLTFENMKELMLDYKSSLEQIETTRVNGEGGKINGIYYYLVSNQERLRIKKQVEEFKKPVTSDVVVASEKP